MNSKKMFVNPNFVPKPMKPVENTSSTFYINPNFNKSTYAQPKSTIQPPNVHINPHFQRVCNEVQTIAHETPFVNPPVQAKIEKPSKGIMIKINKYKSISVSAPTTEQKAAFIKNFNIKHPTQTKLYKGNSLNMNKFKSKPASFKLVRVKKTPKKAKSTSLINRKQDENLKYRRATLKKVNFNCPLFVKYGKCVKKDKDECSFLHDPLSVRRQVNKICKKNDEVCRFYLEGSCNRPECKYKHEHQKKIETVPPKEIFSDQNQEDKKNNEEDTDPNLKSSRYFTSESVVGTPVSFITKREKLGVLPAYIKLS